MKGSQSRTKDFAELKQACRIGYGHFPQRQVGWEKDFSATAAGGISGSAAHSKGQRQTPLSQHRRHSCQKETTLLPRKTPNGGNRMAFLSSGRERIRLWKRILPWKPTGLCILTAERFLWATMPSVSPNGQYHLVTVRGRYLFARSSLVDEEILAHYSCRWKIEVMFKLYKMYLGSQSFMVLTAKAIDRLLIIFPLAQLFFSIGTEFPSSVSPGIRLFRADLCCSWMCSFRVYYRTGYSENGQQGQQ